MTEAQIKLWTDIAKDFYEYSGGYTPDEADPELMLYTKHYKWGEMDETDLYELMRSDEFITFAKGLSHERD